MAEFGVSRTVVREAISKLQASGLVQTRHGIGTFVVGLGDAAPFRIAPEQFATLRDVIAVLELRIGIETEAASLAAQRRKADNLRADAQRARRHCRGGGAGPRRGRARLPVPPGDRARHAERALRRADGQPGHDDHPARPARRRAGVGDERSASTCGA